mgnify:CR=1 FL=1
MNDDGAKTYNVRAIFWICVLALLTAALSFSIRTGASGAIKAALLDPADAAHSGEMIAAALLGTFLGVFLAYGLIGPFAARLKAVLEEEAQFYRLIREVLVANLHNHPANICIEVGRQNTPHQVRPSFADLEQALRGLRQEAA